MQRNPTLIKPIKWTLEVKLARNLRYAIVHIVYCQYLHVYFVCMQQHKPMVTGMQFDEGPNFYAKQQPSLV